MAALDLGGVCEGLAFRIPADAVNHETEILWMREMIGEAYVPLFQTVVTPQGSVEALGIRDGPGEPPICPILAAPKRQPSSQLEKGELGDEIPSSTSTIWPTTLLCLASRMKCSKRYDLSYIAADDQVDERSCTNAGILSPWHWPLARYWG